LNSVKKKLSLIILALLREYKHIVPIEVIERELVKEGASLDTVYSSLIKLEKDGKIGLIFEVRCPQCDNVLGTYCSIKEIPDILNCYHCSYKFRKRLDLRYALRIIIADQKFFRRARSQLCS